MTDNVKALWGEEINWIKDETLRKQTADVWELALERSVLTADDLNIIPFTLLVGPDLKVTFMDHKRSVVHIARDAGNKINEMYHGELTCDMDVLISGAILCDVGKLLEYELDENGKAIQGDYGKYVRHPFSGVSIAEQCGIPAPVSHIIAAHAGEGNMIKRSTEAYVVHHADFMTFLPFKERLK
ncbi:MAG: HDIG domain-containing protein [Bacteroidales bacterium]|nr:HDIG domain-containing protein [Bacteroidales bacterium]